MTSPTSLLFLVGNYRKTTTDQGRCTPGDSIIEFFVVSCQNYKKTLTNKVGNCRPTELVVFRCFFVVISNRNYRETPTNTWFLWWRYSPYSCRLPSPWRNYTETDVCITTYLYLVPVVTSLSSCRLPSPLRKFKELHKTDGYVATDQFVVPVMTSLST